MVDKMDIQLEFANSLGNYMSQIVTEQEVWHRALETISLSRGFSKDETRAVQNISFITTVWAHMHLDKVVLKALETIALDVTMNSEKVSLALAEEVGYIGQTKTILIDDDEIPGTAHGEERGYIQFDEEFVIGCINILETIRFNAKEHINSKKVIDAVEKELIAISANAEVHGLQKIVKRVDGIIADVVC